ncbi:MAG: hypothetical protein JST58_05315 [Bacteroidetes bacterium]|nr:hypothetical protein [Bacteroidota bacterium]
MSHSNLHPAHIFTTLLSIAHIEIWHNDNHTALYGCYGDLLDAEFRPIVVETKFETLNDLITAEGNDMEEVLELISKALGNPSGETVTIDLEDIGGMNFHTFFFSLQMFLNDREDNGDDEPTYWLNACIKKEGHLGHFIDAIIPVDKKELVDYYNKILTLQYILYLSCIRTLGNEKALVVSNLTEPVFFAMAKTHFELDNLGSNGNAFKILPPHDS